MKITWQDFEKIDIRVGTIIKTEDFPEARKPAYILHVDFGSEIGIKKSSAQITSLYTKEQLVNKQVMGVVNFHPKQVDQYSQERPYGKRYAGFSAVLEMKLNSRNGKMNTG